MSSTLHTERIIVSPTQAKPTTAASTEPTVIEQEISDDEDLLPLPNTTSTEDADHKACLEAMDPSVPVNKAIDIVQAAIDRDPDEAGGYICLGKIAIDKSSNHLAAVQQFTTAYELASRKMKSSSVEEQGNAAAMMFMSLQARAAARVGAGDLTGALIDATTALKNATTPHDESAIQDIRKHIVTAQIQLRRSQKASSQQQREYRYGSTVIQEIIEEEDPQKIATAAVEKVIAAGEYTANRAFFKGAELREQREKELNSVTVENEERKKRNAERAARRKKLTTALALAEKEKNKKKGEKKKEAEVVIERTKIPVVDALLSSSSAAENEDSSSKFREEVEVAMKQRQWNGVLELCNKQLQVNNKNAYALYVSAKAEYQLQNYRGCVDNCEAALIALRDNDTSNPTTTTGTTTVEKTTGSCTPFDILMLGARGWKVLKQPDRAIAYLEPAQEAAESDDQRRKAAAQLAEALRMKDQQRTLMARQKASAAAAAAEQRKDKATPLVQELSSTTTTTNTPKDSKTAVKSTPPTEAPLSPTLSPSPPHTTNTATTETEEDDNDNEAFDTKGADEERERGNLLFKQGRYVEALDAYESACVLNPVDPKAFANAAAVLLKLEQWEDCIAQCDACLSLDEKYAKAYRRRAEAYKQLGSLAAAYLDLLVVVKVDKGDKGAVKELEKVKEEMVKKGIAVPDV